MNIQAEMGAALQAKQYDRMKSKVVEQEKQVSLQIMQEKATVIWVDNFSKIYRNVQYRSQYGAYRDANYTAMALLYNVEQDVDMTYIYLPNERLIPGSSTAMLNESFLKRCKRSYEKYDGYTQVSFLNNYIVINNTYNKIDYKDICTVPCRSTSACKTFDNRQKI